MSDLKFSASDERAAGAPGSEQEQEDLSRVDTPGSPVDSLTASDDEGYPYDDEDLYCYRCDNRGFIMICIDDLCRGAGECMHGDGLVVCPDCKGASADD